MIEIMTVAMRTTAVAPTRSTAAHLVNGLKRVSTMAAMRGKTKRIPAKVDCAINIARGIRHKQGVTTSPIAESMAAVVGIIQVNASAGPVAPVPDVTTVAPDGTTAAPDKDTAVPAPGRDTAALDVDTVAPAVATTPNSVTVVARAVTPNGITIRRV